MKFTDGLSIALTGTVAALVLVQPQGAVALSPGEVNQLAKNFTVRINSQTPGSGVIIKQEGKTYTVLTAAHVMATDDDYEIVTAGNTRYAVTQQSIKKFPNVDLATVQFTSDKSYSVATIGDSSKVLEGTNSYIAGFPNRTVALTESIYNFTRGEITGVSTQPLKDGYGLVYTNTTLPGMSGGPVLNEEGHLIGIHGRANTTNEVQDQKLNQEVYVKVGVNLGIPINTALELVPQKGLKLGSATTPKSPASAPLKPQTSTPTPPEQSTTAKLDPATTGDSPSFRNANQKFESGDYKGAIADLSQAIQQNPNDAQAYAKRGQAQIRLGNDQAAMTDGNQAVQLNPQSAEAYVARGEARLASKNYQGALADSNKAIEINPQLADAYVVRAGARTSMGEHRRALADSEKAIQLNPQLGYGFASRGLVYLNLKDYQRAISDGNQAVQLNPQLADAYLVRAAARSETKDHENALNDCDKMIQLEPQNALAYALRGVNRAALGNNQGALKDSETALQIDPNNAHAYLTRAVVRANLGNQQGALEDLKQATSLAQQQGNTVLYQDLQKLMGLSH